MRYFWLAALAILAAYGATPANAQAITAKVVSSCGSPQGVAAGRQGNFTIDTNGNLCNSSSSGGATSVKQALPAITDGVAPYISPSLESCHVMKASQAAAMSYGVTTGATAGFLMVFNATTAPADGAVTPAVLAIQVPANATVVRTYDAPQWLQLGTGFTVCFSSTGPFTKTASATAMLEGTWQ